MKTKVALKGIEFYAFHGFHEIEQKMGNKFAIDVEVELKSFDSVNDDINDNRFLVKVGRYPAIVEDVPARYMLCNEYKNL